MNDQLAVDAQGAGVLDKAAGALAGAAVGAVFGGVTLSYPSAYIGKTLIAMVENAADIEFLAIMGLGGALVGSAIGALVALFVIGVADLGYWLTLMKQFLPKKRASTCQGSTCTSIATTQEYQWRLYVVIGVVAGGMFAMFPYITQPSATNNVIGSAVGGIVGCIVGSMLGRNVAKGGACFFGALLCAEYGFAGISVVLLGACAIGVVRHIVLYLVRRGRSRLSVRQPHVDNSQSRQRDPIDRLPLRLRQPLARMTTHNSRVATGALFRQWNENVSTGFIVGALFGPVLHFATITGVIYSPVDLNLPLGMLGGAVGGLVGGVVGSVFGGDLVAGGGIVGGVFFVTSDIGLDLLTLVLSGVTVGLVLAGASRVVHLLGVPASVRHSHRIGHAPTKLYPGVVPPSLRWLGSLLPSDEGAAWLAEVLSCLAETPARRERRRHIRSYRRAAPDLLWTSWATYLRSLALRRVP